MTRFFNTLLLIALSFIAGVWVNANADWLGSIAVRVFPPAANCIRPG